MRTRQYIGPAWTRRFTTPAWPDPRGGTTEPMDLAMNPGETAAEPLPRDRNHRRPPHQNHAGRADWRRHDAAGRRGCGGGGGGSRESSSAIHGRRSFLPIKFHAHGGIGLVWVARDCELRRNMALKVIQPKYAERADQHARFFLEAEITGKLRAPGIVPVYSLGRNADGRPYYAMRFIQARAYRPRSSDFTRPAGRRPNRRASTSKP